MGTLVLTELREELRAALGGRRDLETRLTRFLNLGQQRLARIHDFEEMKRISESYLQNTGDLSVDRYIQLPGVREIYSFIIVDTTRSRKLVGRTTAWLDQAIGDPSGYSRSIPQFYCIWGSYAEIFPVSDITYAARIRWTKWPDPLLDATADTQTSEFNQKDDVLIEFSAAAAFFSLGKEDDGNKHEARAKVLLGEAKSEDREFPDIASAPRPSTGNMDSSVSAMPWNDPFYRG